MTIVKNRNGFPIKKTCSFHVRVSYLDPITGTKMEGESYYYDTCDTIDEVKEFVEKMKVAYKVLYKFRKVEVEFFNFSEHYGS